MKEKHHIFLSVLVGMAAVPEGNGSDGSFDLSVYLVMRKRGRARRAVDVHTANNTNRISL